MEVMREFVWNDNREGLGRSRLPRLIRRGGGLGLVSIRSCRKESRGGTMDINGVASATMKSGDMR